MPDPTQTAAVHADLQGRGDTTDAEAHGFLDGAEGLLSDEDRYHETDREAYRIGYRSGIDFSDGEAATNG